MGRSDAQPTAVKLAHRLRFKSERDKPPANGSLLSKGSPLVQCPLCSRMRKTIAMPTEKNTEVSLKSMWIKKYQATSKLAMLALLACLSVGFVGCKTGQGKQKSAVPTISKGASNAQTNSTNSSGERATGQTYSAIPSVSPNPYTARSDHSTDEEQELLTLTPSAVQPENMPSIDALARTVYPLVKRNCATCHESAQAPLFAHENIEEAHYQLAQANSVTWSDLQSTSVIFKLVEKIDEQHYCGNQEECVNLANETRIAIQHWKILMQ